MKMPQEKGLPDQRESSKSDWENKGSLVTSSTASRPFHLQLE